jgi:pilus assembly protein FimV
LQNAIKENPDNDSYRVKLAETYYASKNADAFASLATEMHQRGGADTPAWSRMVAIGKELCPEHDLFKGAAAEMVDNLEMDDLVAQSPEPMDIDLGSEGEEQVAELDLGLDEVIDEEAQAAGVDDAGGVEFDLEEAEAVGSPEEVEEEFSLDIEASELDIEEEPESEVAAGDVDFDLDLTDETEGLLATESEEAEEGLSLDDVDTASLEFDAAAEAVEEETEISTDELEIDEGAAAVLDVEEESAEEEMDATAILDQPVSLEEPAAEEPAIEEPVLEESVAEEPVVEEPVAEVPAAGGMGDLDEGLDLSDLDDVDEVSTKLDLARAYLDMGDADGTRSILDEVLAEGNDEQKQEAQELLSQLG